MENSSLQSKVFLVGAAVGSLVGGISALLASTGSGDKLKKEFSDSCSFLQNKASCLAKNVSKNRIDLSRMLGRKPQPHWIEHAMSLFGVFSNLCSKGKCSRNINKAVNGHACGTKDLLIGGVVGGILGVTAGLLLAPKSGEELQEDIMDACHDAGDKTCEFAHDVLEKGKNIAGSASHRVNKWVNFVKEIAESFSDDVVETGEEWSDKAKEFKDSRVEDLMELASLGFRLWNKIRK